MKKTIDKIQLIARAYAKHIQHKVPECRASQIEEALHKAITRAGLGGSFGLYDVAHEILKTESCLNDSLIDALADVRTSWPVTLAAIQAYEVEEGMYNSPVKGDLVRFDCTISGIVEKDTVGHVFGAGTTNGHFYVTTRSGHIVSLFVGDIKEIITKQPAKGYVWVDAVHKGSVIPTKGNQYLSAARYRVDAPTWVYVPAHRGCLEHVYTTAKAASKAFRVGSRNPDSQLKNCLLYECDFVLATVAQAKAYKKDYGKDMLKTGCAYAQAVRLDHIVNYCEARE